MKKIIFVINNFLLGGAEKFIFDLLKHINKKEFEIVVVTILGSGPLENQYRELDCKIYFAGPKKYPASDPTKFLWAPVAFLRLAVFLIKTKPDVVITSLYQADILGIFSAYSAGIKKRIFIQHDVYQLNAFFKWLKKKFAVNLSTQIIANSKASQDFLNTYFKAPVGKIVIIHNGLEIDSIRQGIKENHNAQNLVLGIIGRLEPVKGHIYFLKALKILKEIYNLAPKTLIVGDGTLRPSLEKFVQENNLNNIEFMGTMARVSEALKLMDVLVVPSLSEGFGLVVLEGLLSYKVIIASDLLAIRELVAEKENGLLFKPGDSQQLADIICQVLSSPDVLERLKAKTEKWAKDRTSDFDIKNITQQYEKILR